MATILHATPSEMPDATTTVASPPIISRIYRLTVRQVDQMTATGVIAEDDPLELIEGLLVTKMSRNRPHIVAGKKGLMVLSRIIPPGWHVAKEDPVVASDWSKPEPDLAIVRGAADDYLDRDVMAADVALAVEIAESSLSIDQNEMARVYASSGIPVYWIVNLVARQLEVYTNPAPNKYQTSQILTAADEVSIVIEGREIAKINVAEILP